MTEARFSREDLEAVVDTPTAPAAQFSREDLEAVVDTPTTPAAQFARLDMEVVTRTIYVAPPAPIAPSSVGACHVQVLITPVGGAAIDVTTEKRGLIFSQGTPGGYDYASFRLPRQFRLEYPEWAGWADVEIRDNEEIVFYGQTLLIGAENLAERGEEWRTFKAFGYQSHADDDRYRGILRETRLTQFIERRQGPSDYKNQVDYSLEDDPTLGSVLKIRIPKNLDEAPLASTRLELIYSIPDTFPRRQISRVKFKWKANVASASLLFKVRNQVGADKYSTAYATAEQVVDLGPSNWSSTDRSVILVPFYVGTDLAQMNPAFEVVIYDFALYGTILDGGGGKLKASDILKEVVAASCPLYDTTFVSETPASVDSLVYEEADTRPRQVFDELLPLCVDDPLNNSVADPPWHWGAYERLANDKIRLALEKIEEKVTYEAHDVEVEPVEFDYQGQYNKAIVQYTDAKGQLQEVTRTRTVDILAKKGITRSVTFSGEFKGTRRITEKAQAERVGDFLLRDSANPARAGQITVKDDQVIDVTTGAPVHTCHLKAARYIRLTKQRSVEPGSTVRGEFSVYLVQHIEVDEEAHVARLTLDRPPDLLPNLLARSSER